MALSDSPNARSESVRHADPVLTRALAIEMGSILRKLDAAIRVTESLADRFEDCRVAREILIGHRRCFESVDWVLRWPVEDEFWVAAIPTSLKPGELSDQETMECFDELRQFEAVLVRLSQWLQVAYGKYAPAGPPTTGPETWSPLTSRRARMENARNIARAALGEAAFPERASPIRLLVSAGDRCNFRCRTCYHSLHQDFPYNDISWTNFANLVASFALALKVHVGGFGEPLLSNATPAIVASAAAAGAKTALTTNGSLLHRLAGFPFIDRIEVSFDAGSASLLEVIRKGSQFEQILEGVRSLSEEQRRHTGFNMVVTRLNVHEVAELAALAGTIGVCEVVLQSLDVYLPWHRDMRMSAADYAALDREIGSARSRAPGVLVRDLVVRMPVEDGAGSDTALLLEGLERIAAPRAAGVGDGERILMELAAFDTGTLRDRPVVFLASLEPSIRKHFDAPAVDIVGLPYCLEPYGSMVVNADGAVNPCCKLAWNMGNLNDATVESILSGEQYRVLRSSHRTRANMPATCLSCTDPNRYGNLPDLLKALARDGTDLSSVCIPNDYQMPPALETRVLEYGVKSRESTLPCSDSLEADIF
jgi:MoaA/NifB/PqqE/SkfB family radical SAM enzyme